MRSLIKRVKFKDFSRGMMDTPDPGDIPTNSAQTCNNADFVRKAGKLSKSYGVSEYTFGDLWTSQKPILSMERFVYNKVWSSGDNINKPHEIVIVQVIPSSASLHFFEWYEFERPVDLSAGWTISGPFYIGYDEFYNYIWSNEFKGEWGITWPGRINFTETSGVLRAGCGNFINEDENFSDHNKSNAYPILWKYVNRYPREPIPDSPDIEVNGFFKVFDDGDTLNGECLESYEGIWRGRSIPDFTPTLTLLDSDSPSQPSRWPTHDQFGYEETSRNLYAVLAEYDGHQIAPLKHEPAGSYCSISQDYQKEWTTKLQIEIAGGDGQAIQDYSFPKRLTALRFYRAAMSLGIIAPGYVQAHAPTAQYGPYEEIYRIDIRDGVENVFSGEGQFVTGATYDCRAQFNISTSNPDDIATDLWKDLFIRVDIGDDTFEEYRILWSGAGTNAAWGYSGLIEFNLPVGSSIDPTAEENYHFSINSRWYYDDTAGEDNVKITLLDSNVPILDSPPWLVSGLELKNQPKVECNYTHSAIYKDRNFVWGSAFDDIIRPLMLRWSNEINHSHAGYDLFPNYLFPETTRDDEIVGVANHLDWMLIFTKRKLFKYMIQNSSMVLAEQPWDVGVVAANSLRYYNGKFYFWGKQGEKTSLFVWDGESEPKDIGKFNKKLITTMLNLPDSKPEWAMALPIPYEDKIIFNMPSYELVEPEDA